MTCRGSQNLSSPHTGHTRTIRINRSTYHVHFGIFRNISKLETMHEESMLVERCSLSETGTSKSLALGLSLAAKSSYPVRQHPKSSQNGSKIDPKSILADRGVPGSIQERLRKQPGRAQNGLRTHSRCPKSALGTARNAPRQPKNTPGVLPGQSQDAPGATQDAR